MQQQKYQEFYADNRKISSDHLALMDFIKKSPSKSNTLEEEKFAEYDHIISQAALQGLGVNPTLANLNHEYLRRISEEVLTNEHAKISPKKLPQRVIADQEVTIFEENIDEPLSNKHSLGHQHVNILALDNHRMPAQSSPLGH